MSCCKPSENGGYVVRCEQGQQFVVLADSHELSGGLLALKNNGQTVAIYRDWSSFERRGFVTVAKESAV